MKPKKFSKSVQTAVSLKRVSSSDAFCLSDCVDTKEKKHRPTKYICFKQFVHTTR